MTDRPFGVNLTILSSVNPPPYVEYRRGIIDSGVKMVETTGHKPQEDVDDFKPDGIAVTHSGWVRTSCIALSRARPRCG